MNKIKKICLFVALLIISVVLVAEFRGAYSDSFENLLIGIALAVLIIFVYKRLSKKHQADDENVMPKKEEFSEDIVNKVQTDFEKKLLDTHLPDAITHKDLYIYNHLMREWFAKLAGKYRYDDTMIQKIRTDWIDYVGALEDRNTYNFLSLESNDEKEQESYRRQHIDASRKSFAIEDAFASAIGKEAEESLKYVRELSGIEYFSRNGEIAPKGHRFNLNDELFSDDKKDDTDLESLFEDTENEEGDELYKEAKKITMERNTISISDLQKRLRIGYLRGASLMDKMEKEGIVGEADGANPRKVLQDK